MRRNVNQNEKGRIREIAGKAGKFAATAVLVAGLAVAGCAGKKDVKSAKDTTAQETGYGEMKMAKKKKLNPEIVSELLNKEPEAYEKTKAVDGKDECWITVEEYEGISGKCEGDETCIANELVERTATCEGYSEMKKGIKKEKTKEALLFR